MVSFVVPDVLKYTPARDFPAPESTAIWSDAAVWMAWALWQAYGDRRVLEESYASMVAHVRRVQTLTSDTGLWDTGFQFGDWLDPTAPPDEPWKAKADKSVIATACLHRSARTVSEAAEILGRNGDAAHFAGLAERTRIAFTEHYVSDDGRIHSDASPSTRWRSVLTCSTSRHGHSRALGWPRWWPKTVTTSPPGSPAPLTCVMR
jgi:alpha-L-rhamnosidase